MSRGTITLAALAGVLLAVSSAVADRVPYRLPGALPHARSSPPVAGDAPWTPLVKSLLHQLEPAQPDPETDRRPAPGTTVAELINADAILHGPANVPLVSSPSTCTTIGSNAAPAGTDPVISALCWADAQGVNVESGAQVRQTVAPPSRIGISSSWDPAVANAWGQVEGREARWLGVTGIYAPQADIMRIPDWGRDGTIFGEDPFEAGTMAAAEVNGVQGAGAIAQMKHFAFYDGQAMDLDSRVQDQAAHEIYLTPYEYGTSGSGVLRHPGEAGALMCSYARYELDAAPGATGAPPSELAPAGGALSCDNPLKNYVAHGEWKWPGFFASDFDFAMDSTLQAIDSGTDQEMPTDDFFGPSLVAAVETGGVPLSTFNLALARILYQEERFHLLGHADGNSNFLSPSHPITSGGPYAITAAEKLRDGAVSERASEEGAVLLENSARALPLSRRDLRRGVLVVGESAEYMPADPGTEQAVGYPDRDAISPLEQLRQLAGRGARITFSPYMPGSGPTATDGATVPRSALSSDGARLGDGLERTAGPGAPRVDPVIDFTKVSGHGQLAFGQTYTWTGYLNVPAGDDYTFHFQFSVPGYSITPPSGNGGGSVTPPPCSGGGAPAFSLATATGTDQQLTSEQLSQSASTLGTVPTDPTMAGYTERGLGNCLFHAGALSPGLHEIQISWTSPSSFGPDPYHLREPGSRLPSFRFADSRAAGDRTAAIAAARRAAKVIVFADCTCVTESSLHTPPVNSLDAGPTRLITDMAAANRNTVLVTNFNVATLMPWLSGVRSVLQMWYPGSEGGTATARLLLGQANPSGHLTSTWPRSPTDTIFGYDETKPLYPGDSSGSHPERLSGNGPFIDWTEGIYVGYRFFDREGIRPLFPFGWGLSYTRFRYSKLRVRRAGAGLNVSFEVSNTGRLAGTALPQVYIGAAPHAPAGVQQAVRALAGFARVRLRAGQERHLTIHLGFGRNVDGYGNPRAFEYWDTAKQAWERAPRARRVWVGSADLPADLISIIRTG